MSRRDTPEIECGYSGNIFAKRGIIRSFSGIHPDREISIVILNQLKGIYFLHDVTN